MDVEPTGGVHRRLSNTNERKGSLFRVWTLDLTHPVQRTGNKKELGVRSDYELGYRHFARIAISTISVTSKVNCTDKDSIDNMRHR